VRPQHLSDEAVAAYADDVLAGAARERARRHCAECAECTYAVAVQREAVWALRAAPAPSLPSGLLDRLRAVPVTTPVRTLPTALAPDGTTMLATSAALSGTVFAPMAAFAPGPRPEKRTTHRARHLVATAAAIAVAGVLTAGSTASATSGHPVPESPGPQPAHVVPANFAPALSAVTWR
jgi:hypothetical protein